MDWQQLSSQSDLDSLIQRSFVIPCLIFKHSTRCSISSIAKYRLEDDWDIPHNAIEPYYLDLISNRQVSNSIADHFDIYHESPQALLIWKGEGIYDASHLDITMEDINEALRKVSAQA